MTGRLGLRFVGSAPAPAHPTSGQQDGAQLLHRNIIYARANTPQSALEKALSVYPTYRFATIQFDPLGHVKNIVQATKSATKTQRQTAFARLDFASLRALVFVVGGVGSAKRGFFGEIVSHAERLSFYRSLAEALPGGTLAALSASLFDANTSFPGIAARDITQCALFAQAVAAYAPIEQQIVYLKRLENHFSAVVGTDRMIPTIDLSPGEGTHKPTQYKDPLDVTLSPILRRGPVSALQKKYDALKNSSIMRIYASSLGFETPYTNPLIIGGVTVIPGIASRISIASRPIIIRKSASMLKPLLDEKQSLLRSLNETKEHIADTKKSINALTRQSDIITSLIVRITKQNPPSTQGEITKALETAKKLILGYIKTHGIEKTAIEELRWTNQKLSQTLGIFQEYLTIFQKEALEIENKLKPIISLIENHKPPVPKGAAGFAIGALSGVGDGLILLQTLGPQTVFLNASRLKSLVETANASHNLALKKRIQTLLYNLKIYLSSSTGYNKFNNAQLVQTMIMIDGLKQSLQK